MLVSQEVLVAEVLGALRLGLDTFRVGTYLALWELYPYLHDRASFTGSSRPPSSKAPALANGIYSLKEVVCTPYQRYMCGPKSAA